MGLQTTMPQGRPPSPRGRWYQPKSAWPGAPKWTGTAPCPSGPGCCRLDTVGLLGEDAAGPDRDLELLDREAELAVLGGRGLGARRLGGGRLFPGLRSGLVIGLHGLAPSLGSSIIPVPPGWIPRTRPPLRRASA